MAETTPKVEVKVIQGPPAPPTQGYRVKPGSKLYVTDLGRVAYDNEVVQLTDTAAHAFRDKLIPSPELQDVVNKVTKSAGNHALITPDKRSEATQEAERAAQAAAAKGKTEDGSTPPPQGKAPQSPATTVQASAPPQAKTGDNDKP